MWKWLKDNKDGVSALAIILQATAVIVGVSIAINEFVVKDRQAGRDRVDTAFEIFRGPVGFNTQLNLGDLFFDVIGVADEVALKEKLYREEKEFYTAIVKAARRYTEIQVCLRTGTCDEEVIHHLFCGEAILDAFVAYKIVIRPPQWVRANYDARLDNLFDFVLSCVEQGHELGMNRRWIQRRSEDWDPILGKVFSKIDGQWREVMRDLRRLPSSNEKTAP